jgi:hypothetical protein
MSVYYYEGAQILAPLTITSNEPTFDVDTVSLKKQRASQNVQRWELSFNTVGTASTQIDMFLGAVTDIDEVRTMVMPQLPAVDEAITVLINNPTVGVTASKDVLQVTLEAGETAGIIPKGTFFKFSNHDKIYVSTSVTNLADTTPVINFFPRLRADLTTSHTLKLRSDAILAYYTSIDNMAGITFTDGVLSNAGTIEILEAL